LSVAKNLKSLIMGEDLFHKVDELLQNCPTAVSECYDSMTMLGESKMS
jgi:hypothetical protein